MSGGGPSIYQRFSAHLTSVDLPDLQAKFYLYFVSSNSRLDLQILLLSHLFFWNLLF